MTKEQSATKSIAGTSETAEETDKNILDKLQPDDSVNELQSLELDAQSPADAAKAKESEPPLIFENQLGLEFPVNDETLSGQFDAETKSCEEEKLLNASATQQSTTDSYVNDLSLESVTGVEMLNENFGVGIESERNDGKDFQKSIEIQYFCSKLNGEVEPNADNEGHLKETCVDVSFERGFDAESDNKAIALCDNSDEQKDLDSVGNNLCSDCNSDEIKHQIQAKDHFESKSEYISKTAGDVLKIGCLHDEGIHGNDIENDKISNVSNDDKCTRINHSDDHSKRDDHDVNDEESHNNEKPKVCDEDISEIEHTFVIPDQERRTEGQADFCKFKDVVECSEVGHEDSKCDNEDPASLICNSSVVQNCICSENQDDEGINNTLNQSVNNVLEHSAPIHIELCSSEDKNISSSEVSDDCLNDLKTDISTDTTDTAKDPGNGSAMTKFKQNKTKMTTDKVDISTATEISSDSLSVSETKVNSEDDEKTMSLEVFIKFLIFWQNSFVYMFRNKLG